MYDDLSTPEDNSGSGLEYQPPRTKSNGMTRAQVQDLGDREVPLPNSGATSLLHQWLDGDVSVAVVRAAQGGSDTVDLWNKIHDEAETLRSRTTPLYVHKRIMDSLPDDKYRGHHPWYKRPVAMNPASLIAAGVVLLGIGAAVAHVVFR